jgi:hypothetical protein
MTSRRFSNCREFTCSLQKTDQNNPQL